MVKSVQEVFPQKKENCMGSEQPGDYYKMTDFLLIYLRVNGYCVFSPSNAAGVSCAINVINQQKWMCECVCLIVDGFVLCFSHTAAAGQGSKVSL